MSESFNTNFNELDENYRGAVVNGITDEDILATLEGTCDELSIMNYESLQHISPSTIIKMYKTVDLVMGKVGPSLTRRYAELALEV